MTSSTARTAVAIGLDEPEGRGYPPESERGRGGLARRTVLAGGGLALVVGVAFTVVLLAIDHLRDAAAMARQSEEVVAAANQLERLVIDLETGLRGYLITGDERFLEPWNHARAAFPEQARALQRLTAASGTGHADDDQARRIAEAGAAYIRDYSVPTVDGARRDPASVRTAAVTEEGRRQIEGLRASFDEFEAVEGRLAATADTRASTAARQAIVAALTGIAGSVALVAIFIVYLTRTIVRPVRRAATMAGRLAAGDLGVRLPVSGAGEIGTLERAFNTMGRSLETSHEELSRLADEQAALRRVATLVARAVPAIEVFEAVTREVARLLDAPATRLLQYGPGDTATIRARFGEIPDELSVGRHLPLGGHNLPTLVWRTGRAVRMETLDDAGGPIGDLARRAGVRFGVGGPILVDGRLWGMIGAVWSEPGRLPAGLEARLTEFTELVATAIANADSRDELIASRARVVVAADEARRRIERDLHDGIQQRLVSLALDLRAAEAAVPPALVDLKAQLSGTAEALNGALDDLREITRGIHPAILSRGGLGAALKSLARRSSVPVRLRLPVDRRWPERVEVALYYLVSETLANVAKHAGASVVEIDLEAKESVIRVAVGDDGVGGARLERGSGLIGLRDRIEALGGRLDLTSPEGGGTRLLAEIPLAEA